MTNTNFNHLSYQVGRKEALEEMHEAFLYDRESNLTTDNFEEILRENIYAAGKKVRDLSHEASMKGVY